MESTSTQSEAAQGQAGRERVRESLRPEVLVAYNQGLYDGALLVLGWLRGSGSIPPRQEEYQGELPPRLVKWEQTTRDVIEKAKNEATAAVFGRK